MSRSLRIGATSVEPGNRSFVTIKLGEICDGSSVDLPVHVINGSKDGPILYVGAAIHGNEINGVEIVRRVVAQIDRTGLSGALLAVPIQNPLSFRDKDRWYRIESIDMSAVLPGKPDGGLTETMAYILMQEVISKADYVVDLHTGLTSSRNFSALIPPVGVINEILEGRIIEFAKAFGLRQIRRLSAGGTRIALKTGKPAITVELGEGGRMDENCVHAGVRGIMNIMKYLKMIEGQPELPEGQVVLNRIESLRANHGGLLNIKVNVGEKIRKGTLLASIYHPWTFEKLEEITSPVDGEIVRVTTYPAVCSGDRVVVVGY